VLTNTILSSIAVGSRVEFSHGPAARTRARARENAQDVTVESLAIIGLLDPPVELLLLGSGDRARRPCEKLAAHFRAMGIVVEQTNTVVFLCVLYRPQPFFIRSTSPRQPSRCQLHHHRRTLLCLMLRRLTFPCIFRVFHL